MSTFLVSWNIFKTFISGTTTSGLIHYLVQPQDDGGATYTLYTSAPDGTEYKTVVTVPTPEDRIFFEQSYLIKARVVKVIKRETNTLEIDVHQKPEFFEDTVTEINETEQTGDLDDSNR